MNEILFSNQVIIYLLSQSTLFILLLIAFLVSLYALFHWDFDQFTPKQFALERQSYLVSAIIFFAFTMKFLLVIYFVFSIDALSLLVPGAMCAAGVITANDYGTPLLILKLVILFFLTLWLLLHTRDIATKNYRWFKQKLWLFTFIFILILIELGLDFSYFTNIDTHLPVSCCSTLFGQLEGANPLPLGLHIPLLLVLFYLLYALVILTLYTNQPLLYVLSNVFFSYISYYAVVYFFGIYIYQLPTHQCPFCMMQNEYLYVGYLLWGSLFIGSYLGLSNAILTLWIGEAQQRFQTYTTVLLSVFVLLCSAYVVSYYLKNGVLL